MRKKILIFTTSYLPFIGGAEIAAQCVSRRLCHSSDFYIITAKHSEDLARREKVREGTIIRVGIGSPIDKWLLPFLGVFAVCRLAISGEIPKPWRRASRNSLLAWGMDISQGSLAALLFKMIFPRIPFVLTVQYGYGDTRLQGGRMGVIGIAFRRMLRAADGVTAISSYLYHAAHLYGFAGVGRIIPNGVDASVFGFHSSEKGSENNQKVVITTSRLVHKNGVDTLIDAIAEVKKEFAAVKCYVIGDGPERGALERQAKELGLDRDVIFLGSVGYDEIPFYLRKADVFVRASRSEGMGNSFVEAMSVGVPVVGTSVGGIPDIIIDHETGLFCRVDDSRDLAEKILMLLTDGDLARDLRKQGRRLVEERFSWDAIAASYGHMFDGMMDSKMSVLVATPLYPPEIGGPATYSKKLVEGMLDKGILVRLVRFSEVRKLPKLIRHIAYAWRIACLSRYADYVYAQDPISVGLPASLAAFIARKKFLIKIVGDYAWEQGVQRFGVADLLDDFLDTSYGRNVEMMRKVEYFVARRAKHIIVPSEYLKTVVRRWGVKEKKITVIPNSFEMPLVETTRKEARANLALHDFVLVSAGRLVPWKGFEALIDAASDLIKEGKKISLVVIGSGPMMQRLREKVHERAMASKITLAGHVSHEQMLEYLAAADAFVLNTGYEGFSHALLEAMAMSVPVITTSAGGNPELITNGETGCLIEYNNTDQLRNAIESLVEMSAKERKLIAESAKKIAGQFTKERMLDETAQFLLSI
ncbi:MAG: glycosyltransferase family 4 protein [bacterium]|nr:glycosyltransferase family 4 protein [bacterium]MDZ4286134.1 glycosyltransferase family 4 protein [Candidatus Sungbacteria bacterium]